MRMAHKLLLGAGLLAGAAAMLGLVAREAQSARWQPGVPTELAHGTQLAGKHPLLQWLREYLRQRPKATVAAVASPQ